MISIQNTTINIKNTGFWGGCGMQSPMLGFGMGGSVFGCGFAGGMMPANNTMAAGFCCGALLRGLTLPGVTKAIGKGATWVWNHALKPFGNWVGGLFKSKKTTTQKA